MNSVYVVFSKNDTEFVQSFKNCIIRENLCLDFSFSHTEEVEIIEKKIDDSAAILLLISNAFREDGLIKQTVKYAHDINKTFIVVGFHNGGIFNRHSWLKNEMNINTTEYGFKDPDQLGEILAQLRSSCGVVVAMGERIGGLVEFKIDSPCRVLSGTNELFCADNPGIFLYRLKAGIHVLSFQSKILDGAKVCEKSINVKTNGNYTFAESIRANEVEKVNIIIADVQKKIEEFNMESDNICNSIDTCKKNVDAIEIKLREPEPTLPPAEASTSSKVMYAIGFGFIGACFFGVGAIIGLILGPLLAQNAAESERTRELNDLINAYRTRMSRLQSLKSNELKQIQQSYEKLDQINVMIDQYKLKLDEADVYMKLLQ